MLERLCLSAGLGTPTPQKSWRWRLRRGRSVQTAAPSTSNEGKLLLIIQLHRLKSRDKKQSKQLLDISSRAPYYETSRAVRGFNIKAPITQRLLNSMAQHLFQQSQVFNINSETQVSIINTFLQVAVLLLIKLSFMWASKSLTHRLIWTWTKVNQHKPP